MILALTLSWFFVLGVSNLLIIFKKFKYANNFWFFVPWFLFWATLNLFLIPFSFITLNISFVIVLSLVMFVIKIHSFKLLSKTNFGHSLKDTLSKTSEILFQHTFILALLFTLTSTNHVSVFYFALFFSVIHLPLYFVIDKTSSSIFSLSSFFGGVIFAYIFLYDPNQYFYLLGVHIGFYIILDLIFYLYKFEPIKKPVLY